jgi:hypothetical protein
LIAQQKVWLGACCFNDSFRDARLADAASPLRKYHLALASLGQPPALDQQGQFLIAADDRSHFAVSGGKPAFELALAKHREDGSRLGDSLECPGPQIAQHEEITSKVPRGLLNDDRVRLGNALQPRREIGRLAHHGVPLPGSFADEITYDDHAGGDAGPRPQVFLGRRGQPRGRGRDGQAGAHRTLGVVFMRTRPPERRARRRRGTVRCGPRSERFPRPPCSDTCG